MSDLTTIVDFLNSIGIEATQGSVSASSFLPGVRIESGRLIYDPAMPWPGDLLHEAGHIATAPGFLRCCSIPAGITARRVAWSPPSRQGCTRARMAWRSAG